MLLCNKMTTDDAHVNKSYKEEFLRVYPKEMINNESLDMFDLT